MKAKITIEVEIDDTDIGDLAQVGKFANLVWYAADASFDNFTGQGGVVWVQPTTVAEAAAQEDTPTDQIHWRWA